ncbi:MAG: aminotransferase class I/II-fold pyridoxal phosphate-dependent enzyme [Kineosporiaceae bacterium]
MVRQLPALSSEELTSAHDAFLAEYETLKSAGLKLDLTRGKPGPDQLDLSEELLTLPTGHKAADGTDVRNYGGLLGLPELRAIVAPLIDVPVEQLVAGNNSSLEVMHDCVVDAYLHGVPGSERPWKDEPRVAFLAPVPGYDRHFTICAGLGIELIPVPMTATGPDLDVVERLVAEDAQIKGIWCVPKYSNPSGITYSEETVRRLASMPTAAPDFRLFWDNAYAVHHLTDTPDVLADVLTLAAEAGNPDRPFVFASTSKITFAGAGVAFFGSSPANIAWHTGHLSRRSIGPDKVNHLRHAQYLRDAGGLEALMQRHREILEPKFAQVLAILDEKLAGTGVAEWTSPNGGYFISLDVLPGTASRVVELAKAAGIALTPAGAPFPYGKDPDDRNIRLAPSFPSVAEIDTAMRGVATCVLLAAAEKLLGKA